MCVVTAGTPHGIGDRDGGDASESVSEAESGEVFETDEQTDDQTTSTASAPMPVLQKNLDKAVDNLQ